MIFRKVNVMYCQKKQQNMQVWGTVTKLTETGFNGKKMMALYIQCYSIDIELLIEYVLGLNGINVYKIVTCVPKSYKFDYK